MRVVLLGSQFSVHVVRWANALSAEGFEVHLITLHTNREYISEDVRVHSLPFRSPYGYILNIYKLRELIAKIQPDLIHTFYAFGYGFLGRFSGVEKKIISVMGSDIYDDIHRIFPAKLIIRENIKAFDIICSTSYIMSEQIRIITGINKIEITPFGVDTELFSPASYNTDASFTIGTVKFLEAKYGLDVLIKGFALFRKKYPDDEIYLKIAGDGSLKNELILLTDELGIKNDVEFLGYVNHLEIPEIMRGFDVFAALSRFDSESFGVAVVEAMACELPVVVTDVGGLKEVVKNQDTGIIIPNESSEDAAEVFEKLYLDKSMRIDLGKRSRRAIVKNFNWIDSIIKMKSLYKKVIAG